MTEYVRLLTPENIALVTAAFDEIIVWLARWRGNAEVNAAYRRLVGTLN